MLFVRSREKELSPEEEIKLDLTQLEDEIAVIFNEEVEGVPPLDPSALASPAVGAEAPADSLSRAASDADAAEHASLKRQSSLTQKSLAALAAFDDEMRDAGRSLEAIGEAVSTITAAQHAATRFVGGIRAIILRSSDLEETNAALVSENRRQAQQIEQARSQQSQQDALNEANKRRIEQLVREAEEARMALGTAQLEAKEARDALAEVEGERALLIHEVAAKTAAGDRLFRETEALRQKHLRQQVDLAELEQRCLDAERKLEEAAAQHKTDATELSELRLKLETGDTEHRRIQKQAELAQMRLGEAQERLMTLEADLEELTSRHASTLSRFRSETEALKARLDAAARKAIADEDEIGRLRQQLNEAVAATKVLEYQLSSASGRHGAERPALNGHSAEAPIAEAAAIAAAKDAGGAKRAGRSARD